MPVATPEQYAEMLDKAKTNAFAYPAINVSSSSTISARRSKAGGARWDSRP